MRCLSIIPLHCQGVKVSLYSHSPPSIKKGDEIGSILQVGLSSKENRLRVRYWLGSSKVLLLICELKIPDITVQTTRMHERFHAYALVDLDSGRSTSIALQSADKSIQLYLHPFFAFEEYKTIPIQQLVESLWKANYCCSRGVALRHWMLVNQFHYSH
jgi:hypothetical protein